MNSSPSTKPSSRLSGLNPARLVRSLRGQKKVIESTDFDEPPAKETSNSRPRSKSSARSVLENRNNVNLDAPISSAATAEFGNAKGREVQSMRMTRNTVNAIKNWTTSGSSSTKTASSVNAVHHSPARPASVAYTRSHTAATNLTQSPPVPSSITVRRRKPADLSIVHEEKVSKVAHDVHHAPTNHLQRTIIQSSRDISSPEHIPLSQPFLPCVDKARYEGLVDVSLVDAQPTSSKDDGWKIYSEAEDEAQHHKQTFDINDGHNHILHLIRETFVVDDIWDWDESVDFDNDEEEEELPDPLSHTQTDSDNLQITENSTSKSVKSSKTDKHKTASNTAAEGSEDNGFIIFKRIIHILMLVCRLVILFSVHFAYIIESSCASLLVYLPLSRTVQSVFVKLMPFYHGIAAVVELLLALIIILMEVCTALYTSLLSSNIVPYDSDLLVMMMSYLTLALFGGHFATLLAVSAAWRAAKDLPHASTTTTAATTVAAGTAGGGKPQQPQGDADSRDVNAALMTIENELLHAATVLQTQPTPINTDDSSKNKSAEAKGMKLLHSAIIAVNPTKLWSAVIVIGSRCAAVLLALRFSFAKTIALGSALAAAVEPMVEAAIIRYCSSAAGSQDEGGKGDEGESQSQRSTNSATGITEDELNAASAKYDTATNTDQQQQIEGYGWLIIAAKLAVKVLSVYIAWTLRRTAASLYSAIRGSRGVARAVTLLLSRRKMLAGVNKQQVLLARRVFAYVLAALAIYIQLRVPMSSWPSIVRWLLIPLRFLEMALAWTMHRAVGGGSSGVYSAGVGVAAA